MSDVTARIRDRSALLAPLAWGVGAALVTRLIAALAIAIFQPAVSTDFLRKHHLPASTRTHTLLGHAAHAGFRWDAGWYASIAAHGYDRANATFFPLYPLLLRAFTASGLSFTWAANIVSTAALALAAAVVYRIALELGGRRRERATNGVLLWLVFPTAAFLSAAYPESLLALLVALTWWSALRGAPVRAGLFAGAALLTRPMGVVALPLIFCAPLPPVTVTRRRVAAGVAMACAIGATWPLYLQLRFGDALLFMHAQDTWHRHVSLLGPVGGLIHVLSNAAHAAKPVLEQRVDVLHTPLASAAHLEASVINLINFACLLLLCGGVALTWRVLGPAAAASVALIPLVALTTASDNIPLISLPRFVLSALPMFVGASLRFGPRTSTSLIAVSAALFGLITTGVALWQVLF